MQPPIYSGEIKKVEKKGNILKIHLESDVEIDENEFRMHWKILKARENRLAREKMRMMDIARKANIKLD